MLKSLQKQQLPILHKKNAKTKQKIKEHNLNVQRDNELEKERTIKQQIDIKMK